MNVLKAVEPTWEEMTHKLGIVFAKRATQSDLQSEFAFANYQDLKKHQYFSAMIPKKFGGGGLDYEQMCELIRVMAHYCSSTALAFSMHQHLVAATIWKYQHKGQGAAVLQKVVDQQLVLVSTGARDWLGSNGEMERTEGGYLFSGKKAFASQSVVGDIAVTSAPYLNEDGEWKVLHFSIPIRSDGVHLLDDWDVLGMRSTGSQTIQFDRVFVPDRAITLTRERGEFHPVWSVVLTVAMPLVMAAYVGIAEKAMEIALQTGKKYYRNKEHLPYIIGKLNNNLLGIRAQWKAMYTLTNNFDFKPREETSVQILSLKTNVADSCIALVSGAMEAIGGQSFYRKNILERLFRDVQAAQFHPMPKWDQYAFTGKRLLEK